MYESFQIPNVATKRQYKNLTQLLSLNFIDKINIELTYFIILISILFKKMSNI